MKKFAIIVAGGSGKRMGSQIPKQFLLLQSKPIIFHTIEKFIDIADEVIVVLPEEQIDYFRRLQEQYSFNLPIRVATGGKERFHSVQNGLKLVSDVDGIVAVHDAVRPLIGKKIIHKAYSTAAQKTNCVVSVPSKDSIRHVSGSSNKSVPRSEYFLVQTPQVFDLKLLNEAYQVEFKDFTDDASVFERAGHHIHILEGEYSNIKITTPEDLYVAEAILQMNS